LIRITESFYHYVYMDASLNEALKVLNELSEARGLTEDLSDAIRILNNFNIFYNMMRRKFKEYLAPKKNEADLLLGKVIVDKLKLYRVMGENRVTIVFDKRFAIGDLINVLKRLGIKYEFSNS